MPPRIAEFTNSYARLPDVFWARVSPTPVAQPRLVQLNRPLADELGLALDGCDDATLAAMFAGNLVPEDAALIATAYAGHQFGNFVPRLGDGRAILMGEVVDRQGARRDLQWKGCGPTPFSRHGDGRAALGPVLREYLVSEAMQALGIPTTRALAAVATGQPIFRETVLPGAVLVRVAASHVRVGTMQYFAARGDAASVKILADYVIDRHYPALREAERPYLALFDAVVERQARLVAHWMSVGFVHGVMNTDNMSLSGETIDYGPCAFLDAYDAATVFSSIDQFGRYAYGNQMAAARWNLARLAETLLGLFDPAESVAIERAMAIIEGFEPRYEAHWLGFMRRKLGLATEEASDLALARDLFEVMQASAADFTATFRLLGIAARGSENPARALFPDPAGFDRWTEAWRARLARDPQSPEARADGMDRVNPAYIPRNGQVEAALTAAVEAGEFGPFGRLLAAVTDPFVETEENAAYGAPPPRTGRAYRTFCGT